MVLRRTDQWLTTFMRRWGVAALRTSFGIVFIWFGILKPLGLSPAEPLVLATVKSLPVFDGPTWVVILGWWEVAIGLAFLFRRTIRFAILLLAFQMLGTLLPLVLLPHVTFQPGRIPYGLTMEGQYIIKNLMFISAALVVGGATSSRRPAEVERRVSERRRGAANVLAPESPPARRHERTPVGQGNDSPRRS